MNSNLPSKLSALAAEINREHRAAEEAINRALLHARRAGDMLLQAKAQVAHGEWAGWIHENLEGSLRTAQRYMRVASRWEELEEMRHGVSHLPLSEALKLLAEPQAEEPGCDATSARPPMTYEEAVSITKEIKESLDVLFHHIALAFQGGAWRALGYDSWGDYVNAEVITPLTTYLEEEDYPDEVREFMVEKVQEMAAAVEQAA